MKKYGLLLPLLILFSFCQAGSQQPESAPLPQDTILLSQYLQRAHQLEEAYPDSAVPYYKRALHLAEADKEVKTLGHAYMRLFLLFFKAGKYEDAFDLATAEVAAGKRWNSDQLQMKGYNNLAIGYQFLNDYQTATAYYLKSATLANQLGDGANEAKILDNMSSLLLKLKDYKAAYTYGLRSSILSRQRKDSLYLISGLISMGGAMGGMEKYDSALMYLNEAEAVGARIANTLKGALVKVNKGIIYLKLTKPNAAIREFSAALALAKYNHYPYLVAESLKGLADCEVARKDYPKAEQYTDEAIGVAKPHQLGTELAEMYDNMAMIKQHLGKSAEAYAYKDLYNQVNDSIMNLQIQTSITKMNIQYNAAKKDKEILQQKFQLAKTRAAVQHRNTWLLLVLVVVMALTVILVISLRNYHNKKKFHAQTVISMQKEQEVVRLKALMDGKDEERRRISAEMHDDIGSGLTSILFLSNYLKKIASPQQTEACEKIRNNANSLIGKMNEIIWSMNSEYDRLEDLVTYLRHQASEMLENAGVQYCFHVPHKVPEMNLSAEQRRNIYLTVKEALHNIIKHAGATEVTITFQFDGCIAIVIGDNGKGFAEDQQPSFGNGLKNMRRRMSTIGGRFEIKNDRGVTVALSLPLTG